MRLLLLIFFFGVCSIHFSHAFTESEKQTDSITQSVNRYNRGFINEDFELIRNAIGSHLTMINGNFSGELKDWQAHQFLNEGEIDAWIEMMLINAKPFENNIDFKNVHVRGNSAIVVTQEKGKNKFRYWEREQVAYLLGRIAKEWKIVGIFIKNLKNPE